MHIYIQRTQLDGQQPSFQPRRPMGCIGRRRWLRQGMSTIFNFPLTMSSQLTIPTTRLLLSIRQNFEYNKRNFDAGLGLESWSPSFRVTRTYGRCQRSCLPSARISVGFGCCRSTGPLLGLGELYARLQFGTRNEWYPVRRNKTEFSVVYFLASFYLLHHISF